MTDHRSSVLLSSLVSLRYPRLGGGDGLLNSRLEVRSSSVEKASGAGKGGLVRLVVL